MILLVPIWLLLRQSPTVTVTFTPTPVPRALEILSKVSGRKLDSVPALADEVVLARLKNASLDIALSHLAEALCAKWEQRPDGTLRLTQDPVAEKRLELAKEAKREKDFYEGLEYIKRRLAEEPQELDDVAVKATAAKAAVEAKRQETAMANNDRDHMFLSGTADEESASWRAACQIALLIDAKTLLDMPEDAREVWAERPTAMQHPFPEGSDQILARYRRELILTKPNVVVSRVKIAIEREGTELWARFSAIDPSGQVEDKTLVGLSSRLIWGKLPSSQRSKYVGPTKDDPVSIPEEAREARIALASAMASLRPELSAMISKCRPKFLDPVKFEPTQWHVGQDLILAAEATDKNLIGTVSDFIGGKFYLAGLKGATALKPIASQILSKNHADFMPTTDGWLVIRPEEGRYRWSRSKAKDYLAEGLKVGGISVDAAANWAGQSTEPNPVYDWMWDYLQVLFSGPGSFNSGWDGRSLKLWNTVGSENINALRRGGTISLSMLPADAQAEIAKGVYWLRWIDDPADPTDKLPNGITDGTLTMTVAESTVLHGCTSNEDPSLMQNSITPENIGRSQALGEKFYRNIERWQVGVHRVYDLHFSINPGKVPMTVTLEESIFDPNSPVLTKLPDEVLAEIEKARQYAIAHPQPPGEYPPGKGPEKKAVPPP